GGYHVRNRIAGRHALDVVIDAAVEELGRHTEAARIVTESHDDFVGALGFQVDTADISAAVCESACRLQGQPQVQLLVRRRSRLRTQLEAPFCMLGTAIEILEDGINTAMFMTSVTVVERIGE